MANPVRNDVGRTCPATAAENVRPMTIIERYIFRRMALMSLAALSVTTGIALTTQVLVRLNFISTSSKALATVGELSLLLIPPMIVVVMPFALLIGVLQTLRAMNQDSELAVIEASGLSTLQKIRPALVLGVLSMAFILFVTTILEPATNRRLRMLITRNAGDLLTSAIEAGTFKQIKEGVFLQVASQEAGGLLKDIFVSDRRDPKQELTYVAQSGRVETVDDRTLLVVHDGQIQRKNAVDGSLSVIHFSAYSLDAATFTDGASEVTLGPQEQSTLALFAPDTADPSYQRRPDRFVRELHRRFSEPLYAIEMIVVGLFFTARARSNRRDAGEALVLAALAGFGLRGFGYVLGTLSGQGGMVAILSYAIPAGISVALLWLMLADRRFRGLDRVRRMVSERIDALIARLPALRGPA